MVEVSALINEKVKLGIHVPRELHRRFRAMLLLHGEAVQDVIRSWIEEEFACNPSPNLESKSLWFFRGMDRHELASLAIPMDRDRILRLRSKLLIEGRTVSQWATIRMERYLAEDALPQSA